jgi:thiazole/oxazole-forming peptide maturase SagD family component
MQLIPLDLDSPAGASLLAAIGNGDQPATPLANVVRHIARSFIIKSPFAPGFCCVGAEVAFDDALAGGPTRFSVTGNGETLEAALTSCLGEAADVLSQFERPDDIDAGGIAADLADAVDEGWIGAALAPWARAVDWVRAADAVTRRPVLLPADFCLRRSAQRRAVGPVGPLSAGAAAGPTIEAATLRAILELCERDAAALWWLGGQRARRLPLEHPGPVEAVGLMDRLRHGAASRRTSILDISTDLDVPVVAAISVGAEGRGLACGIAARLDWRDAAKAAILEMCQMELSAPVAERKRQEAGEAALNDADRRHLSRAAFDAAGCELLRPDELSSMPVERRSRDSVAGLIGDLQERGVRLYLLEHTRRDIGVPVVRAVSPDLQPLALDVATERLSKIKRRHGDCVGHVPDVWLF